MNKRIITLGISVLAAAFLITGCNIRDTKVTKDSKHEQLLSGKDKDGQNTQGGKGPNLIDTAASTPDKNINIQPEKISNEKPIDKNKKIAYLTFDDTMSENTVKILDILKKYEVKATFFPNMNSKEGNVEFEKQMLKRMVAEGHAIGNHTASHDYSYVYSSIDHYIADTDKLNNYIYETVGVKPNIIRFPGGSNNQVSWKYGGKAFMKQLIPKVRELGYQYFDWNVSSADAAAATVPKENILNNVINGAKGKKEAIILMHQSKTKTTTAQALPEIIEGLKAMDYQFDSLSKDSYTSQFLK
jgi:peptidoglycan/xylan/chitin deacetylase (PgdA/CDA1 family)